MNICSRSKSIAISPSATMAVVLSLGSNLSVFFEVFQKLHSQEEYAGTGIRLAIVKKIVENHHGIITATGELNKGATFDIYIPAD